MIVVIKVMGKEGFSYCNTNKSGACFKQRNSVPFGMCQNLVFFVSIKPNVLVSKCLTLVRHTEKKVIAKI